MAWDESHHRAPCSMVSPGRGQFHRAAKHTNVLSTNNLWLAKNCNDPWFQIPKLTLLSLWLQHALSLTTLIGQLFTVIIMYSPYACTWLDFTCIVLGLRSYYYKVLFLIKDAVVICLQFTTENNFLWPVTLGSWTVQGHGPLKAQPVTIQYGTIGCTRQ